MDSPLLKYSAKDYFFKAALCHFCVDMLNAKVPPACPDPPIGVPGSSQVLAWRGLGTAFHILPFPWGGEQMQEHPSAPPVAHLGGLVTGPWGELWS